MKVLSFLSAALLVSSACSLHVPGRKKVFSQYRVTPVKGTPEECKTCIEFAGQTINDLLNFVLQEEVDACGDLCQMLVDKTGKKALGAVCTILCDIVGIKEFINAINKADFDPIYLCELVPVCPVNDHGDATFTMLDVSPKKGPQGEFDISFEFVSKNGTGTGELAIDILTVDGIPVGVAMEHVDDRNAHVEPVVNASETANRDACGQDTHLLYADIDIELLERNKAPKAHKYVPTVYSNVVFERPS